MKKVKKILHKIADFFAYIFGLMTFLGFCGGGVWAIYLVLFNNGDLNAALPLTVSGLISALLWGVATIAKVITDD